jgi:hypothetical protein
MQGIAGDVRASHPRIAQLLIDCIKPRCSSSDAYHMLSPACVVCAEAFADREHGRR